MLKTEFMNLYEELTTLYESKADTQRLIDFAGQDLADRFLNLKQKLKSPENDLYYWIKNKTPEELETFLNKVENTESKNQAKKNISTSGAKLLKETAHGKIYHITTFEAAQAYGRDTKWCITGINNYGSKYGDEYTDDGWDFYFFITKGEYNPRGADSKFAFALNRETTDFDFYDQQDDQVELEDIPYYEELEVPELYYSEGEYYYCANCGRFVSSPEIYEDEKFTTGPDGQRYCMGCFDDLITVCTRCGKKGYKKDFTQITGESSYNYYCPRCFPIIQAEKLQIDEHLLTSSLHDIGIKVSKDVLGGINYLDEYGYFINNNSGDIHARVHAYFNAIDQRVPQYSYLTPIAKKINTGLTYHTISLNSKSNRRYVGLDKEPNEIQYKKLTKWLDKYFNTLGSIKIYCQDRLIGKNLGDKIYDAKNYTVDDIIDAIKTVYKTGKIVESLKEPLKQVDYPKDLIEAFTYTEDEILSDEEVKEIKAKLEEINKRKAELWELIKKASRDEHDALIQERSKLYTLGKQLYDKLSKHEAIMKYKSDSAAISEDHIATEEEGDNCLAEFTDLELEVDGLEIEVEREEDEYPSGWNPMTDSIIYTTVPGGTGTITSGTITVDATKEWIADFIGKKIEEVTAKDLLEFMYGDYEDFIEYLTERDDVLKLIEEDALENYDYDDVEWYEYEPEYDPDDYGD